MAKISTNQVTIYHKDIQERFELIVNYNSDDKFYIRVPDVFSEVVNHLSDEECKEIGLKKSYSRNLRGNWLFSSETEADCLQKCKKGLELLTDKRIEKRNVIILFYNSKNNCRYGDHEHNPKHPQIGIQIGLTYAIEATIGSKKVYSTYNSYEAFGEVRTTRKEIHLWEGAATVIPDTPKNREVLENVYEGFKALNAKMEEFTQSTETLQHFIASNLKLLNP